MNKIRKDWNDIKINDSWAIFKIMSEFVEGYVYVIPCLSCREHFEQVLVDNPVPDAEDLFNWSVDLHNIVNRRLGKPEVSYEAALANIVSHGDAVSTKFDFKIAVIVLLLFVILFLILNRK